MAVFWNVIIIDMPTKRLGFCWCSLCWRWFSPEIWSRRAMEESIRTSFYLFKHGGRRRRPSYAVGRCKKTSTRWRKIKKNTFNFSHPLDMSACTKHIILNYILFSISNQMMVEVSSWPYSFPSSEDFPKSNQRGNVYGKLLVHDR